MIQIDQADIDLAKPMALFSAAAYPKGPTLTGDLKVTYIGVGQFSAIVIREKNRLTIAVTGTDSPANFISDADCWQVRISALSQIKVHKGFLEGLEALWIKLVEFIVNCPVPIFLTGHSLGAAIGRLIQMRMKLYLGIQPAGIVTFGEPRSMNKAGAKLIDSLGTYSVRWVNKLDIVPRIPLVGFFPDAHLYWHCYNSAWIDLDDRIELNRPWYSRIKQDLRGFWAERKALRGDPLIGDHSIAQYQDSLNILKVN